MEQHIIENPKQFILGGKAFFTITNKINKKHLTFKVNKCEDKQMFFVSVCNDYDKYMFIGCLYTNQELTDFNFIKSKKISIQDDPLSVKTFKWIIDEILIKEYTNDIMEFFHHCKCCKCGRTLTTPDSIKQGIGDYCKNK